MKRNIFVSILVFTFITLSAFAQDSQSEPKKTNARTTPTPEIAAEPFDKADVKAMAAQCVRFDTEAGSIEAEMFPESAPETVRNFLNLAAIGAFDTTTFSRVVPGFVIQGGNLWSSEKMTAALGKRARRTIPDEPNKILHQRGILSMARSDQPNSATTDFFILVGGAPHLDGTFAAFGKVTRGIDVVDKINKAPVTGEKPEKPVRIIKASVVPCAASTGQ